MDPEKVLTAVELVPPGSVVSYGDIAELVGTSARRVGAIMSRQGSAVPWWRVTNASGELPADLLDEAGRRWAEEGIRRSASGRGCRIAQHRADLLALGAAWEATQPGDPVP